MNKSKLLGIISVFLLVLTLFSGVAEAAGFIAKAGKIKAVVVIVNSLIAFAAFFLVGQFIEPIKKILDGEKGKKAINYIIILVLSVVFTWKVSTVDQKFLWTLKLIKWFLFNAESKFTFKPLVNTIVIFFGLKIIQGLPRIKDALMSDSLKNYIGFILMVIALVIAYNIAAPNGASTIEDDHFVWETYSFYRLDRYAFGEREGPDYQFDIYKRNNPYDTTQKIIQTKDGPSAPRTPTTNAIVEVNLGNENNELLGPSTPQATNPNNPPSSMWGAMWNIIRYGGKKGGSSNSGSNSGSNSEGNSGGSRTPLNLPKGDPNLNIEGGERYGVFAVNTDFAIRIDPDTGDREKTPYRRGGLQVFFWAMIFIIIATSFVGDTFNKIPWPIKWLLYFNIAASFATLGFTKNSLFVWAYFIGMIIGLSKIKLFDTTGTVGSLVHFVLKFQVSHLIVGMILSTLMGEPMTLFTSGFHIQGAGGPWFLFGLGGIWNMIKSGQWLNLLQPTTALGNVPIDQIAGASTGMGGFDPSSLAAAETANEAVIGGLGGGGKGLV